MRQGQKKLCDRRVGEGYDKTDVAAHYSALVAGLQDEYELARGFCAFMEGLPADFQDLGKWLDVCPYADPEDIDTLFENYSISVVAGLPFSHELALRGMSPAHFFLAIDSVGRLLERMISNNAIDSSSPVLIDCMRGRFVDDLLQRMAIEEMVAVSECPPSSAPIILGWAISVASFKPYMFRYFEATDDLGVCGLRRITKDGESYDGEFRKYWTAPEHS